MRDQPRAVAFRGFRYTTSIIVAGGKEWDVTMPGFAAKDDKI